ncbi:hypothetical protein AT238_05220 [Bartonella henselae]|nr:hypothetical protein AT243_04440 [Bartonella henselae]OLL52730.1 hypothetical protein AT239_03665 [Bartonella henselae]OLL54781.1 hypothetical protein AT238_05220 [Bartonella henselae]OLL54906.1 hypothetical protein AT240_07640 [Bartonella henselae]
MYLVVRDALSRKERDGLVFSSLGLGKRDFGAFSGYVSYDNRQHGDQSGQVRAFLFGEKVSKEFLSLRSFV